MLHISNANSLSLLSRATKYNATQKISSVSRTAGTRNLFNEHSNHIWHAPLFIFVHNNSSAFSNSFFLNFRNLLLKDCIFPNFCMLDGILVKLYRRTIVESISNFRKSFFILNGVEELLWFWVILQEIMPYNFSRCINSF